MQYPTIYTTRSWTSYLYILAQEVSEILVPHLKGTHLTHVRSLLERLQ